MLVEAEGNTLVSASEAPCSAAAEGTSEGGPRFPERPGDAAVDAPQHVEMLCTSPAFQRQAEGARVGAAKPAAPARQY